MYKDAACYAVVAAAGSGERFRRGDGAVLPKQFALLGGVPVIARSLALFEGCSYIDAVVVSVGSTQTSATEDIINKSGFKKIYAVATGGQDRQSSVYAGLKRVMEIAGNMSETAIAVVHDAVRPLARRETLEAVIAGAYSFGGAIAATTATDTVKEVKDGFVDNTPARERMFLAQTPQAFRLRTLLDCHESAAAQGFRGSDDAVLLERLDYPVYVVETGSDNIKITTAMDLPLAEMLLKEGVNNGYW